MSTAAVQRKTARPRRIYTGGEKPDLEKEREVGGFTQIEHSLWVDMWAILPPSVHACIVLLVLRHTAGEKQVKGKRPEWTQRLGTAYFAEYARCDQQSVRDALNQLIKRKVIAEKDNPDGSTPGSCQFKCLTADWPRLAEESPWPRQTKEQRLLRKGIQSAGGSSDPEEDQGDEEESGEDSGARPPRATVMHLLPHTVFRPGQKKKLDLDTGAKSVTVRAEAATALQVDNHGGDITVIVRSVPVLVEKRNKGEDKKRDPIESITSRHGSQVDLASVNGNQLILDALLSYGPVDHGTVSRLLRNCPGANEEAILDAIRSITTTEDINAKNSPIGFLVKMIPEFLRGHYIPQPKRKSEPVMSERERLAWEISRMGRKPRE